MAKGTKQRRKIAENFNRLSRANERYRQTTDGRAIAYIVNVNVSPRSLKTKTHSLLLEKQIIFC